MLSCVLRLIPAICRRFNLNESEGQKWRCGQGQGGADQHGNGDVEGDGGHVWSHHAGDEAHGYKGQDDGEGRENHRATQFADARDRGSGFLGCGHPRFSRKLSVEVFGDGDRIVHQRSQSQNQRKQGNAIDRLSSNPAHQQRPGQGQRNHQRHDQRLAPTQEDDQQCHHNANGDKQTAVEIPHRSGSGATIVAANGNLYPGWQLGFECLNPLENLASNDDGVGALFLGNANGNGRLFDKLTRRMVFGVGGRIGDIPILAVMEAGEAGAIAKPIPHGGNISQIDGRLRVVGADANDDVIQVSCGLEPVSAF